MKVLFFTSPTCGPCRQLKPNMAQLQMAKQFSMQLFEASETTKSEFEKYRVRSIPTVIGLNDTGEEVGRFVGAQSPDACLLHLKEWGVVQE